MTYDLIIVVCSSKPRLIEVTQNCIDSARSEGADLNIIIIETYPLAKEYKGCETIRYKGSFNYNRALNQGLARATGDIHILANNDLIFHPGWSQIGELMQLNDFGSASVYSATTKEHRGIEGDFIYPGYLIGFSMAGWCIFATKETIKTIGKLDETYQFWYSDNVYADQLQRAGIKHGLFCNIRVDHLTSMTLKTLPLQQQRKYARRIEHAS